MDYTDHGARLTVFSVAVWPDTPGAPLVLTITAKDAAGALRKVNNWYPECPTSNPEPSCPYGDPECPAPGTPRRHLKCGVGKTYRDETERPLAALNGESMGYEIETMSH